MIEYKLKVLIEGGIQIFWVYSKAIEK